MPGKITIADGFGKLVQFGVNFLVKIVQFGQLDNNQRKHNIKKAVEVVKSQVSRQPKSDR